MERDLAAILRLEELDRDLFRGENEPGARERVALYGGQVAAQALAAAGALGIGDTARLLRIRGRAMQKAVPVGTGAMAALLGLDFEQAVTVAGEAAQDQVCQAANDNGGGQVVVSGDRAAVERAVEIAKGKGARRAMMLPVSAPFHCSLMQPAADVMAAALAGVIAAAGAGLWGAFAPASPPPRSAAITLSADNPATHVAASAVLNPVAAGTVMKLTLVGLPQAVTCHLVVHGRDGRTETAAGWASGWSGGTVTLIDAHGEITQRFIVRFPIDDSGIAPCVTFGGALVATAMDGGVYALEEDGWRDLGSFGYDILPPAVFDDDSLAISGYGGAGFCRVGLDAQVRWRTGFEEAPRNFAFNTVAGRC